MGIRPGDRVATLCMNHVRHLEAHFGVPAMGAILHTLNPRLHADDLGLIVRDAGDRAIVVDALPRTATGTSKKAELRAQFGSAPG